MKPCQEILSLLLSLCDGNLTRGFPTTGYWYGASVFGVKLEKLLNYSPIDGGLDDVMWRHCNLVHSLSIVTARPVVKTVASWWRHQMEHFPRNWPFVRGIHRSPVNSPHKGQWRGALMFSLIWVWINDWVNNREAGDLRRYRAHYDVIVMINFREAPSLQDHSSKNQVDNVFSILWPNQNGWHFADDIFKCIFTEVCSLESQIHTKSAYWFRYGFTPARIQAITRIDVEQDLWRDLAGIIKSQNIGRYDFFCGRAKQRS